MKDFINFLLIVTIIICTITFFFKQKTLKGGMYDDDFDMSEAIRSSEDDEVIRLPKEEIKYTFPILVLCADNKSFTEKKAKRLVEYLSPRIKNIPISAIKVIYVGPKLTIPGVGMFSMTFEEFMLYHIKDWTFNIIVNEFYSPFTTLKMFKELIDKHLNEGGEYIGPVYPNNHIIGRYVNPVTDTLIKMYDYGNIALWEKEGSTSLIPYHRS